MTLQLLPRCTDNVQLSERKTVWEQAGGDDWASTLSAGPLALSTLGICYVAASYKEAALVELPQKGGHLRYAHVRANLIHCSDLGREAFREAEMQMRMVQMSARQVCEPRGTMHKLIRILDNDRLAGRLSGVYISQLHEFSTKCKEGTEATKNKFNDWSKQTQEFFTACSSSKDDNFQKLNDAQREEREQATIESENMNQISEVDKEKNEAVKEMERYDKEFNDAIDSAKPKWKDYVLAGGETVEKLAHHGMDLLGRFVSPPGYFPPAPQEQAGYPAPEPITQNIAAPETFDIGLLLLTMSIRTEFRALTMELPPDEAAITQYCKNAADCVRFMAQRLEDPQFTSLGPDLNPAVEGVLASYKVAVEAAKELVQIMGGNAEDGPTKDWDAQKAKVAQGRLKKAYNDYERLSVKAQRRAQANTQPLMPSLYQSRDGSLRSQRWAAKMAKADMAGRKLSRAETKLRDLNEEHRKLEKDLRDTKELMKELRIKCQTLEGIRGVLKKCFEALGKLKIHIIKLHEFFETLNMLVEKQLVDRADGFKKETADPGVLEDDGLREFLKADARILLLWFAFAFELSSLYVEVSSKHIMPNIEKLDQLAILAGGDNALDAEDAGKKIHAHLEATQRQIQGIAERKRDDMRVALKIEDGQADRPEY